MKMMKLVKNVKMDILSQIVEVFMKKFKIAKYIQLIHVNNVLNVKKIILYFK